MRLLRALMRLVFACLLVCGGLATGAGWLAPAGSTVGTPQTYVVYGHDLFYSGKPESAVESYRKTIEQDPKNREAWLNGAVVLADLGELKEACRWYRRAIELAPGDAQAVLALAEAELRRGALDESRAQADRALALAPDEPHALILKGRLELARGRPELATEPLREAAAAAPDLTLAHFWLGRALDAAGRAEDAIAEFEAAAGADSSFTRARFRLAEALGKNGYFSDAYREAEKLVDAAPGNRSFQSLKLSLARRLRRDAGRRRPPSDSRPNRNSRSPREARHDRSATRRVPQSATRRVPILRVGVGTNGMGEPLRWRGVRLRPDSAFSIHDAGSGRRIGSGAAGSEWDAVFRPGPRGAVEIRARAGKAAFWSRSGVLIRPAAGRGGSSLVREIGKDGHGRSVLTRRLRGDIEVSARGGALKVVNAVDLESYTHGVLSAEMPVRSPMEALKAQAVIARTHALFIRDVRRRHGDDGYHLCDGQHCQVYRGVAAERERSRAVVEETEGRVVTHRGKVAHVLYSSNCGGHTQSAGEIRGWGEVPYFQGSADTDPSVKQPGSPWELRLWLRSRPKAFCAASNYAHPSHFRWNRVFPAEELEARLHRQLGIGRLRGITPLTRSRSGHVNAVRVRGSRATKIVNTEMRIRGLFGIGSQRSSLFIVDTEFDRNGRPANFIFYGGGWGHAVGLCQSGAMGRAERGQTFTEILQAYYKGVEIGNLRY